MRRAFTALAALAALALVPGCATINRTDDQSVLDAVVEDVLFACGLVDAVAADKASPEVIQAADYVCLIASTIDQQLGIAGPAVAWETTKESCAATVAWSTAPEWQAVCAAGDPVDAAS